jgi:hypothetical protein
MPTTFTRVRDGKTQTRIAHTAAEHVKLRFEGWTADDTKPDDDTKTTTKTSK